MHFSDIRGNCKSRGKIKRNHTVNNDGSRKRQSERSGKVPITMKTASAKGSKYPGRNMPTEYRYTMD